VETRTSPADWGAPVDDAMVMTVVDVLQQRAKQVRRGH
jgi:hypothetical protein